MNNENKEPLYEAKKETNIDEVVEEVTSKNKKKEDEGGTKKSFFDINFSWGALLIIAGATFGISYAHQQSLVTSTFNSYAYLFIYVICSFLFGLVTYNLGKIVFGAIASYKIASIDVLGFKYIFKDKEKNQKGKASFSLKRILELHMAMRPTKENANPTLMLLGGTISFLAFAVIDIVLAMSLEGNIKTSLFYGAILGSLVMIYEILPVRLDCPNDMYLLIHTRKEEGRIAFNLNLLNAWYNLRNEDLVSHEFESYDDNRLKAATLVTDLHNACYEKDFKKANELIEKIIFYKNYLDESSLCETQAERLYVYLSTGRTQESDKLVVKYSHDLRNTSNYTKSISALRTDVLIGGLLDNSLDETKDAIRIFVKQAHAFTSLSERTLKEIKIVNENIAKINSVHPDWKVEKIEVNA